MIEQTNDRETGCVRMTFDRGTSSGDSVKINGALPVRGAQRRTREEMLPIIQHQASEMWIEPAILEPGAEPVCRGFNPDEADVMAVAKSRQEGLDALARRPRHTQPSCG